MTTKTTRVGLIALLASLALAGCGGQTPATAAEPEPTIDGESLLAEPPEGWVGSDHTESPGLDLVGFIPADQYPADWREKVSFERMDGQPLDPIDLLTALAEDQSKTCDNFSSFNTFTGFENGYPTSVRLFSCGRNSLNLLGQVTLIKVIQGSATTYVVMRAKRTQPFAPDEMPIGEEEIAEWSLYMRAISVCDPNTEDHPCPT